MSTEPGPGGGSGTTDLNGLVLKSLDQAPFAALVFRADDLTLLWRNATHAILSNSTDRDVIGRPMFAAFPPSDDESGAAAKAAIESSVERIRQSLTSEDIGPYRFDLQDRNGDYVEHHWQMRMSPVTEDGEVVAILQVAQDVTETVLANRVSETLKRSAQTTAAVSYFSFDPGTGMFDRSGAIDAMFGFRPGEAGTQADPFFARVHPDDLPGVHAEVQRVFSSPNGEVASFDYRVNLPDGSERFLRIRGEVVTDPADRRDKLVGSFVDLTDLEKNRRALKRSLAIREALIAEANHRIKNSLAIAIAMLRLQRQAMSRDDSEVTVTAPDILNSVESRIRAIADVHSLMQLTEQSTSVSLRSLMERLVNYTRSSAGIAPSDFRVDLGEHDITLESDKAINLGLVLNELLTNALKYGTFPDGRMDIDMTMQVDGDGLLVEITNAVPEDVVGVGYTSTNLGSRLVEQLGTSLGATIDRDIGGGACCVRLRMTACPA